MCPYSLPNHLCQHHLMQLGKQTAQDRQLTTQNLSIAARVQVQGITLTKHQWPPYTLQKHATYIYVGFAPITVLAVLGLPLFVVRQLPMYIWHQHFWFVGWPAIMVATLLMAYTNHTSTESHIWLSCPPCQCNTYMVSTSMSATSADAEQQLITSYLLTNNLKNNTSNNVMLKQILDIAITLLAQEEQPATSASLPLLNADATVPAYSVPGCVPLLRFCEQVTNDLARYLWQLTSLAEMLNLKPLRDSTGNPLFLDRLWHHLCPRVAAAAAAVLSPCCYPTSFINWHAPCKPFSMKAWLAIGCSSTAWSWLYICSMWPPSWPTALKLTLIFQHHL